MKHNGLRIDETAQDVLRRIYRSRKCMASTRDITDDTGLDKDTVRYRFDRLDDAGVVTTSQSDHAHEGTVATLTDEGREAVETGLLGDIFDATAGESTNAALRERVDAMEDECDERERQMNVLRDYVAALLDACEDEGIGVEEYIEGGISADER